MALKAKLEKLDGLNEVVAKEYKKVEEEGKTVYVLDVDGAEDTGALKRAKDHEKAARQKAEKDLKDAQDRLLALEEERDGILRGAIPKGDVEKLENSYKEKNAKKEKEFTDKLSVRDNALKRLLVDRVAVELAGKISKAPTLMLPHVQRRLAAEEVNGEFVTRVLDKDGKPSALTIDELQKELCENPEFKDIIVASKASGGGASGAGGGNGSGASTSTNKNLAKASARDLVAHMKATGKAPKLEGA